MNHSARFGEIVEAAWRTFRRADALPSRVNPAIPILFFGDLDACLSSELRVLTVGLNPSLHEFPEDSPFLRFPDAESGAPHEPECYLKTLSNYFHTCPYRRWFSGFEHMLGGMDVSYYHGNPATALHGDICSPVATNPTWNDLDSNARATLEQDGGPLWHDLVKVLQPHIVTLSVARRHLRRIKFSPITDQADLHVFESTTERKLRTRPVRVCARWYEVNGEPSLFVSIPAAQTPLGNLSHEQKREAGRIALEAFHDGP